MKRILYVLLASVMLFAAVSCSASESTNISDQASSFESESNGTLEAISMDRFQSEVKEENLGTVKDISVDYGYDAALVTDNNNISYIYMYMPTSDMAESVLTDSNGNGRTDNDLTLEKKGENYDYYTQYSGESTSTSYATYGKCLRVGSMILIVSGEAGNKKEVANAADTFFKSLGYNL